MHPTEIRLAVEKAFAEHRLIDYACEEIERLSNGISDETQKRQDAEFQKEEFRRRLESACRRSEDWAKRALNAEQTNAKLREALDDPPIDIVERVMQKHNLVSGSYTER